MLLLQLLQPKIETPVDLLLYKMYIVPIVRNYRGPCPPLNVLARVIVQAPDYLLDAFEENDRSDSISVPSPPPTIV